jgi:hypothetical protein
LVIYMQKTESRPLSLTLYPNQFQIDKRSWSEILKLLQENRRENWKI